jgi:hypothetical protein
MEINSHWCPGFVKVNIFDSGRSPQRGESDFPLPEEKIDFARQFFA